MNSEQPKSKDRCIALRVSVRVCVCVSGDCLKADGKLGSAVGPLKIGSLLLLLNVGWLDVCGSRRDE